MATKKAKSAKTASKAKPALNKGALAAKKTAKKVVKTSKTLLGKLAQRSAQLILASGVLGEPPKSAPAKKRARKARAA
jgi:hypothetical protein